MKRFAIDKLLLVILVMLLPSVAGSADWTASLEFSVPKPGADTGSSRVTLTAGIDPSATEGIDRAFDVIVPSPPVPVGSGGSPTLQAYFDTNGIDLWSDFRSGQFWPQVWRIELNGQRSDVTLRWGMTAGNQCNSYEVTLTDGSLTAISPGVVTLPGPNTLTLTVGAPTGGGPPTPPGSLIVSLQGRRGGLLIWSRSPQANVVGYNIYRSVVSGGDFIKLNDAPMNAQAYFDRNLTAGTVYYYRVRGVNQQGCESQDSEEAVLQMGNP
jgi:hypothetical protein